MALGSVIMCNVQFVAKLIEMIYRGYRSGPHGLVDIEVIEAESRCRDMGINTSNSVPKSDCLPRLHSNI